MSHSGHALLVLCLSGVAALQVTPFDNLNLLGKLGTKDGKSVRQTLRSDEGMAYYGTMKVGGQPQQAIYDTGSFEIVLLSHCSVDEQREIAGEFNCCPHEKCPKAAYSAKKSIFWKAKNTGLEKITYGSGPVTVKGGYDQVSLSSGDAFEFLKGEIISDDAVPLRVIVDHDVDLFYETPLQAIVGLGPGEFAHRENRMVDHLGIKRFMTCYQEDPMKDGFITWSDKDRSMDEEWMTVPVLGKTFWATPASDFKLVMPDGSGQQAISVAQQWPFGNSWDKEKTVGCTPSCGAVVDTGTSLLTPPPEAVDQIQDAIEAKDIEDCSDLSKFPTLAFKLHGKDLSLPPQSYIGDAGMQSSFAFNNIHLAFPLLPMKSEDLKLAKADSPVHSCVLMLTRGDDTEQTPWGPMLILGMSLFRKYSVQFDLSADFEGKEPSMANPTRMMRFAEAAPDCTETKSGIKFRQIMNVTGIGQTDLHQIHSQHRMFSSMQKVNLKKLRVSHLQKQLKEMNDKKKESLLQQKTKVKL